MPRVVGRVRGKRDLHRRNHVEAECLAGEVRRRRLSAENCLGDLKTLSDIINNVLMPLDSLQRHKLNV